MSLKKSEARSKIREAEKILEEVRREMFLDNGTYTSEEVHELALAQFACSKARDRLEKTSKR